MLQTYQPARRMPPPIMPRAGYVPEAPVDDRIWGRINGVWDLAVALAGAIMQGRLYLAADPVHPMEAVTLQYAQSQIVDGGYY